MWVIRRRTYQAEQSRIKHVVARRFSTILRDGAAKNNLIVKSSSSDLQSEIIIRDTNHIAAFRKLSSNDATCIFGGCYQLAIIIEWNQKNRFFTSTNLMNLI